MNGIRSSQRSSIMRQKIFRPSPTQIDHMGFKFLITDRPSNKCLFSYIQELKQHQVKKVVRVCEASYKEERFTREGISVYDLAYDDGSFPPTEIINEWFKLLRKHRIESPGACIAVHCVSGLGRAPVLVALTLIELGLKYEDVVELIRDKRRGAINAKQLEFLAKYRPKSRLNAKKDNETQKNSCHSCNSCSVQ